MSPLPSLALYIHFPWCVQKCPYCDFNSHAVREAIDEAAYIDALLADLEQDLPLTGGRALDSLFMGGGTPSLFSPAALNRLLEGLRSRLTLAPDVESNEILVRFSAYDNDPSKLDEFSKQIAPLILSGPPGVAVTGGRPRKRGVITYWPTLVPKDEVIARVLVYDNGKLIKETEVPSVSGLEEPYHKNVSANEQRSSEKGEVKIPLIQPAEVEVRFYDLCLARSGDKGDTANIGVLARSKEIYDFLVKNLTADFMKFMFKEICKGRVIRYELPNILALNFLLEHSLDGGGTRSLKLDAQGKTYAQAFLNQRIRVPKSLLKGLDVKFKEI